MQGIENVPGFRMVRQVRESTARSRQSTTGSEGAGRIGGLAAALIVGVFTPMPAYYTSWGRYTQLAALLIAEPHLAK